MTVTEPELKDGRIVAIAGPVVDVEFPPSSLPEINSALGVHDHRRGRGRSTSSPRSPSRSVTTASGPSR